MIGVIVTAHGNLASALVETATMVVAEPGPLVAISVEANDDSVTVEKKLQEAVQQLNTSDGVLVLTDMFGGTPSQVGMTMHVTGRFEILTGANLPMLIKALQIAKNESNLSTVARRVKQSGERAIVIASDILTDREAIQRREQSP